VQDAAGAENVHPDLRGPERLTRRSLPEDGPPPPGLHGDEGELRAVSRPLDEARHVHALVPEEPDDLPPEGVVAGHPGEVAGKPPARQGREGRRHGPAPLDDHVAELAFRIGFGPGGDAPEIVEGTLAETEDVHGPPSFE